ncbi:MAG TPA: SDR family oxidoreductase [Solirubrobacteraceae bacterium]
MEPELRGRSALVTGGASGIGRAIAAGLEREGASVAVADRNPPDVGLVRLTVSLGEPAASEQVVADTVDAFGRLDLLVHCPAVARHEPLTRLSLDALQATLTSNFTSCVWTCRAAAARMVAAGGGSILVIGSTSVYTPAPTEAIYRASKAALKAFVEVAAIELAPHRIRVNVLTAGTVRTPLTAGMGEADRTHLVREIPLGREAVPDELVPTALLLLSDRLSPYTTGAEFPVDGGIRLRPLSALSSGELLGLNQVGSVRVERCE